MDTKGPPRNLRSGQLSITREGLVIRAQSGFLTVETEAGEVTCRLRGRLKLGGAEGDIVGVGDRVSIEDQGDGTGTILEVHERQSAFYRVRTGIKRDFRQIILANPDQIGRASCRERV